MGITHYAFSRGLTDQVGELSCTIKDTKGSLQAFTDATSFAEIAKLLNQATS